MVSIRGSLITFICSEMTSFDSSGSDVSTALTLVNTDVETAILGFQDLHEVWANVAQLGIAIWLLGRQISWACMGPVIIAIG